MMNGRLCGFHFVQTHNQLHYQMEDQPNVDAGTSTSKWRSYMVAPNKKDLHTEFSVHSWLQSASQWSTQCPGEHCPSPGHSLAWDMSTTDHPGIPTTIKTMGVNYYLRVLIIQMGVVCALQICVAIIARVLTWHWTTNLKGFDLHQITLLRLGGESIDFQCVRHALHKEVPETFQTLEAPKWASCPVWQPKKNGCLCGRWSMKAHSDLRMGM